PDQKQKQKPDQKRGELTLDLMGYAIIADTSAPCGSWLASDGVLTANQPLAAVHKLKLWERACSGRRSDEGYLAGAGDFAGVHIRCCGNGCFWLRPYGALLWQTPECRPSPK
ncbi:hypothetical protein RG836_27230, partial [Pseudomonas sp. SZMC_28357]|uniref:hypothetical protein n=1 Tax=Pseudomonas sp. SZMC_28357 TaxID=3074380 RepID=UPI002871BBC4